MSKRIVSALFIALLVISSSSLPANGSSDGNRNGNRNGVNSASSNAARRATRTPRPTQTVATTATSVPTMTSVPTATNTPSPPREQGTIDMINERRATIGLPALRVDPALTAAALRHSNDIGPLRICGHDGTDGSSPWSRIADAGYTGSPTGEVIGCGFSSIQLVVDAWWGSPTHHSILTSATANDIGCGWWIDSAGRGWVTCDLGRSSR